MKPFELTVTALLSLAFLLIGTLAYIAYVETKQLTVLERRLDAEDRWIIEQKTTP